MLRFVGSGTSHVGRVRDHNEDAAYCSPYLALVADGVGGAAAGEVASATAAYVVAASTRTQPDTDPVVVLGQAIHRVVVDLHRGAAEVPERAGMATTLTALATDGHRVVMAHVGDSRAYVQRGGRLARLSHDHTFVQALVDSGDITADAAGSHPMRNVVMRSLHAGSGGEADVQPDIAVVDALPGDRFLVCSDGLTDMTDEDTVGRLLLTPDPQQAADALVDAALEGGGRDNVTVLVVDLVDDPGTTRLSGDGALFGAMRDPRNVVDPGPLRD
ncbi:protein phosphatase 2C domain-containing protein [Nocardioides zeae]|uniref:Protein phosphatase 2C domain-containing protein n=1 Tax=Nocardioides imazamoxiresistens TaxID=3231893 RepID=A0ABU3PUH2_9ACTN|nr:protein phosphatase 2C domain-containing protein [Nocardioides zeae]MDT9592882.1 protein phosphatase 2C domain-containing protein [Nocardioides zeae]